MAKYCEIAGQVTNCTDNCRECLEEELQEKPKTMTKKFEKFTDFS